MYNQTIIFYFFIDNKGEIFMNYNITGSPFPIISCDLSAGESINCQKGAMVWMTENMKMETSTGGLGKMVTKAFTGESIFHNTYTAYKQPGSITFGTNCPGTIIPFNLSGGNCIIAQKGAYLASEPSINFEVFLNKKVGSGLFGGEGFIMQKFTGNGMLFLEIDGSVIERVLAPGETLLIDTGYLAAMESSVSISIDKVKGVGNVLFGGEGLFNTKVTGPGRVWLQTMPIAQFAGSIIPYIPSKS